MDKRKKKYHSKKRIFLGNQYTKKVNTSSRDRTEEKTVQVKTMKTSYLIIKN